MAANSPERAGGGESSRFMAGGVPPIQFAPARVGRIAYQSWGEGPAVVAIPPLAQNIEIAWQWPAIRSMLERLGSFSTWTHFDKRGTGASDRRGLPGLDERVEDLRAVMDHAEIERAFLYGASEGGPMCLLFAASYPERVDGLILHGTTPSYVIEGAEDRAAAAERRMALAAEWGTPNSPIVNAFAPSLAQDPDFHTWHQRYERLSADQDSLAEMIEMMGDFDVTDLLPELDMPTLVMHRADDPIIPVEYGRSLAEAIPGAKWIEHPGRDHFAYAGEQDWLVDLERFVTGTVQDRPAGRPRRAHICIQTLGRFRVEIDGREVPTSEWRSRIPREICKRLVVARGWPITRDELFEAIWPDVDDRSKLSSRLSVHLSAVRRVLRGGVIADRQSVALDLDHVETDLESFFSATDDETVIDLYTGTFLPEDTFEDWTRAVRHDAQSRFTAAARRVAVAALSSGDHQHAISLARRLVETDRWDETGHRLVVNALLAAGDVGLARQAHDRWVCELAEIGVDVDPWDRIH